MTPSLRPQKAQGNPAVMSPKVEVICAFFSSSDLVDGALGSPSISGLGVVGRSGDLPVGHRSFLVLAVPSWDIAEGNNPSAAVVGWGKDLAQAGAVAAYLAGDDREDVTLFELP